MLVKENEKNWKTLQHSFPLTLHTQHKFLLYHCTLKIEAISFRFPLAHGMKLIYNKFFFLEDFSINILISFLSSFKIMFGCYVCLSFSFIPSTRHTIIRNSRTFWDGISYCKSLLKLRMKKRGNFNKVRIDKKKRFS